MAIKFSIILLNYQRPDNLEAIYSNAIASGLISDIVVWDNSGSAPIPHVSIPFTIITSGSNLCTYGRFKALRYARSDHIFTQDDDWLPSNFQEVAAEYCANQDKIVASLTPGHMQGEGHGRRPWVQLGWLSAFHRSAAMAILPYREQYGEDELLCRKFDRIWTMLHGSHRTIPADGKHLPGATDKEALYRRADHAELTQLALERVRSIQR